MTNQGQDTLEKLYLGYTKAQLDAQYDQRTLVPDAAAYMRRWRDWSDAHAVQQKPSLHSYGNAASEKLDLYGLRPGASLHLHLHGGAWRALSRGDAGFVARGLGASGAAIAVIDFDLAPAMPLGGIVDQVRRAFQWLRANAGSLSGSTLPISVSGHSSGAHLAACLLDTDWWAETGLRAEDFGAVFLASGIYDLMPVRLSARNEYLQLSEAEARALSPLNHLPDRLPPLKLFWGEGELPEFRRQSRTLAQALAARGTPCETTEMAGLNHFDIYDIFHDPASTIAQAVQVATRKPTRARA